MSDLDENLTSILSSLIDTEGIEASNATELTDASTFNSSRLDFENLADCITGSDASLHQCSDENVSSLLESHLNELTHTESTNIVEVPAEQLDDVTSFDLDKPIESLLETEHSEFASQDCSHSPIPIVDKSADLQSTSNSLNTIQNEALIVLQNEQTLLNQVADEISDNFSQSEVEPNFLPNQSNNNTEPLDEVDDIEVSGTISDNLEASCINEIDCIQPNVDENEGEQVEIIIADQIPDEVLAKESHSKQDMKKRRRILVYNDGDSENSELEEERERLLHSKSPSPVQQSAGCENQSEHDANLNPLADGKEDHIDDGYLRNLNEKPGPKSKKQSTYIYNALKAKALIESAIVIPVKKKKKRVIDSDDELSESALNQPIASVDDIGLIPDDSDNNLPFDVSIQIERTEIQIETKPQIRVKTDLIGEPTSRFIKKESLNRTTTQAKMEKYHANNNRRNKNETKDVFGIPLNA